MSFQTHPTYLDFEAANQPYAERLDDCLAGILAEPDLFARFLNTLSMMEHMGSRRIMLTQNEPDLAQDTLKHMAEEARHAFFFKRQAEKFAGRSMAYTSADTIAAPFARMYFMRLESHIAQTMQNVAMQDSAKPLQTTYLYMSMIIEFRAVWAFDLLQRGLDNADIKLSLKSLLAEEQGHLADMESALANLDSHTAQRTVEFLTKERELFTKLLTALERTVSLAEAA
ncbi:hypothetical protein ACFL12_07040 [Pseudomonadota bacterium]